MAAGYKEDEILLLTLPSCIRIMNAYAIHLSHFEEIIRKHAIFTVGGKHMKKWKLITEVEQSPKHMTLEEYESIKKLLDEKINPEWLKK